MSASKPYIAGSAAERTVSPEAHVKSCSDDTFFDNFLDIINDHPVVEVEASLERRS